MDKSVKGGTLIEIVSGGHLFKIERDDRLVLHYIYSSPGTDTREAKIDLTQFPSADKFFIAFTWSPEEIRLSVGPKTEGGEMVYATGEKTDRKFKIGKDGKVFQLGDQGVQVMEARVYEGGKLTLDTTALDSWRSIVKAVEILLTGKSDEGYIFEVAKANLILVMLVTGFETYTKKRFIELETEGIIPDTTRIYKAFYSKSYRFKQTNIAKVLEKITGMRLKTGLFESLSNQANDDGITLLQLLVNQGTINFQNYKLCKKAYNKAYNIKFSALELESSVLERIQKYIGFRHKIIRVSPLLGILNQEEIPNKEPVTPNEGLAISVKEDFQAFINALHRFSLTLNRND